MTIIRSAKENRYSFRLLHYKALSCCIGVSNRVSQEFRLRDSEFRNEGFRVI